MDELKPLDIAYRFCQIVLGEYQGTRDEIAQQLGITPAWLTIYKRKIEELYDVSIKYSRKRKSYYVNENERDKLRIFI